MDFKSLLSKIDSIEPVEKPVLPESPKPVQLNEEAELRVLAGRTTIKEETALMEKAVSKSQQQAAGAALAAKRGDAPKSELKGASKEMMSMSTKELEKFAGTKHKGLPKKKTDEAVESDEALNEYESKDGVYKHKGTRGSDYDGSDHSEEPKKKEKSGMTGAERRDQKAVDKAEEKKGKEWEKKHGKGSVTRHKMEAVELDTEAFKSKFLQMVEAKKKEDKKVDEMKKEKMSKKDKKMDEASKPDFLDIDKDGDKKEPMKKAAADKGGDKKDGKKGMSAKQEKYFGKKTESAMMPKGKKRPVKESVEPKMSFREMMKLVVESGGQQAIDPLDQELFAWATRVAKKKLGEGFKSEVYAGMVYERMGGRFEMYDVLSEDQ